MCDKGLHCKQVFSVNISRIPMALEMTSFWRQFPTGRRWFVSSLVCSLYRVESLNVRVTVNVLVGFSGHRHESAIPLLLLRAFK